MPVDQVIFYHRMYYAVDCRQCFGVVEDNGAEQCLVDAAIVVVDVLAKVLGELLPDHG